MRFLRTVQENFFSFEGRLPRGDFWLRSFIAGVLLLLGLLTELGIAFLLGEEHYPLFKPFLFPFTISLWLLTAVAQTSLLIRRLHDRDKSGFWALLCLIPYVGVVWWFIEPGCMRGSVGDNKYGPDSTSAPVQSSIWINRPIPGPRAWLAALFKKKVCTEAMHNVQIAKLAVFLLIFHHIQIESPGLTKDQVAKCGGAWSNFLFGEQDSDQHHDLNLDYEKAKAVEWLNNSADDIQELVVQSLRIKTTAISTLTGNVMVYGEPLLKAFGKRIPNVPNPESFNRLVSHIVQAKLTPDDQGQILKWILEQSQAK